MEQSKRPTIVPDYDPDYDNLNPGRLEYTYLHGKLQDDCGYDCYGLTDFTWPTKEGSMSIDHKQVPDGEYALVYKGEPCTLYFWHCSLSRPHGLVVYDSDNESVEYAKNCMSNKVNHI